VERRLINQYSNNYLDAGHKKPMSFGMAIDSLHNLEQEGASGWHQSTPDLVQTGFIPDEDYVADKEMHEIAR